MIRNFMVKEEQEIVNNYDDIANTKGFQQIKKIVKSHGYFLSRAFIEKFGSELTIQFNILEDHNKFQPSISYNNERNEFTINPWSYGEMNLQESKLFIDGFDSALQLCKKLSKMNLLQILPILDRNKSYNDKL